MAAGLGPGSVLDTAVVTLVAVVTDPRRHALISRREVGARAFTRHSRSGRLCPPSLCAWSLGEAGGIRSWGGVQRVPSHHTHAAKERGPAVRPSDGAAGSDDRRPAPPWSSDPGGHPPPTAQTRRSRSPTSRPGWWPRCTRTSDPSSRVGWAPCPGGRWRRAERGGEPGSDSSAPPSGGPAALGAPEVHMALSPSEAADRRKPPVY